MGRAGRGAGLAVEEALELLHDDYAYEFQIGWSLWELETERRSFDSPRASAQGSPQDDIIKNKCRYRHGGQAFDYPPRLTAAAFAQDDNALFDARWVREPRLVRVTGYGPLFDEGAYEQDGHIRMDFGSDAPFLEGRR